ncbi:hypothetical protein HNP36_001677 [Chryseobacterium shigense]|uniref:Uncharacterized protein n=1 Tax=Chryseobacterium shigense TaxID=297244 RepID=A0A841N1A3_9FLAO|nr:hypothetical protein [Chryseobacterium shigense]
MLVYKFTIINAKKKKQLASVKKNFLLIYIQKNKVFIII